MKILSERILSAIENNYNSSNVYEIRLRKNCPVVINFAGKNMFLINNNSQVIASTDDINFTLSVATKNSLYAYSDQIKSGFITIENGIRIGIAGECVTGEDGVVKTIKNVTSLAIRIPHEIDNCAHTALAFILNGGIKSTLIVAPPGAGKTTFLRDIARHIADKTPYNVTIADERMEIASVSGGVATLSVGKTSDIISKTTKDYAFSYGIRSLAPDVLICDELASEKDALSALKCKRSGVKIIATIHGASLDSLKNESWSNFLIKEKCFERIIVLSNKSGPGTYEAIYDENLNLIY